MYCPNLICTRAGKTRTYKSKHITGVESMKKRSFRSTAVLSAAVLAGSIGFSASVSAAHEPMVSQSATRVFATELMQLNNSGDYGSTIVEVTGNQATFKLYSTSTSPGLPHAQHLHLNSETPVDGTCPDISADANNDGFISTVEGLPNYGAIEISLTQAGDTSPASGLALGQFPVSEQSGEIAYERTITVPAGLTADDVSRGVIVQHGISELFDDPMMYDGEKRSSLTDAAPFEATVPASCGALAEITETVAPPVDEISGGDNGVVVPAAPVVGESTVIFGAVVASALDELRADGHMMAAEEFGAAYAAATSNFERTVADAAGNFDSTNGADLQGAKNQYIDAFNNAKAVYFNELDMAKNQLAIALSGKDDAAKDMFINQYNQARDAYGNQLEVIKNDFVAAL